MNIQSDRGHWTEITPTRLSKKDQNHSWIFAVYWEFSAFRDDKQEYSAFLFRNDERTLFGLKEYLNRQMVDYRKLATRVIQDKEFRESFISSDPDLPKIWKKH